ncbi:MAG TPA: hypothetical protein VMU15_19295 [Anaeromyxobacter sp.]|nr:hypothetical protein [Anaeromyxobacter sp.]
MVRRPLAAARPAARRAWLLALLLLALPAGAAEPRAGGRLDADDAHVEVLGKPVAVGERIELPEGWLRVEEQGVEDRDVGSFTVAASPAPRAPPARAAEPAPSPGPAVRETPAPPSCHAERGAYLRELWRMSGIEVDDPEAVLRGLEAEGPGAADAYLFALSTDPVRALAWSSELRDRARDLARCVRERDRAPPDEPPALRPRP